MNRKRFWSATALLALCWLSPFAMFVLAEFGLRYAGYGEDLAPFLFESHGGTGYWVFNERFLKQFLSIDWDGEEVDAPAVKPACVKRVAVLGESAAHGYPTSQFAFPRCLEALLRARYPGVDFEFLNVAYPGVDSQILYAEARAAVAAFQPDAFVVYMGNNEAIGPFGPHYRKDGSLRVPSVWMARATIALDRLRLTQWCRAWLGAPKAAPDGSDSFGPHHPETARIYANFRTNLRDICSLAERAGIPVVLCTVATALRDWMPCDAPDKAQRPAEWTALFDAGAGFQQTGDYAAALARFEAALERYPDDAEVYFRIGQCHWALGDYANAKEAFLAARERDAFLFARARDPINAAIRSEAAACASHGVYFADVEAGVAAASENGIPGIECFLDQCHFSFRGATAAAWTVLPEMTAALGVERADPGNEDLETALSYCAKALAFSKESFAKEDAYRNAINARCQRFDRNALEAWRAGPAHGFSSEEGVDLYQHALGCMPGDYPLSLDLAEAQEWGGRLEEAVATARSTVSRYPCRRKAQLALAHLLARASRMPPPGGARDVIAGEAKEALALVAALEGEDIAPESALSVKVDAFFALERYADAMAAADALLAIDPENVVVRCLKGDAAARLGDDDAARAAYLEVIAHDPCNVAAFTAYQTLLSRTLDTEGQIAAWQELSARFPESPFPHGGLGGVYGAANRCPEALAAYRDAAGLDGSACDLQYFREKVRTMLIECGYRFLETERYEEAKALFGESLERGMDAYAVLGMAAVYRKENRPDLEEALLKDAIVQLPEAERLYTQYDDFLYAHYGDAGRNSAWAALRREHPDLPYLPRAAESSPAPSP